MSYTIYDAYFPVVQNALKSLTAVLEKSETSSNHEQFVKASIHPDMLPLRFQVNAVTKICQEFAAKCSGDGDPQLEDNMASYADFYARIKETQTVVAKVGKDIVDSRAQAVVPVLIGAYGFVDMPLFDYIIGYAIPNILFHLTTAYDILRKEGVELGKVDYLRPFMKGYL